MENKEQIENVIKKAGDPNVGTEELLISVLELCSSVRKKTVEEVALEIEGIMKLYNDVDLSLDAEIGRHISNYLTHLQEKG